MGIERYGDARLPRPVQRSVAERQYGALLDLYELRHSAMLTEVGLQALGRVGTIAVSVVEAVPETAPEAARILEAFGKSVARRIYPPQGR